MNGSKKSPRHNKQSPHQLTKHKKSVPSESEEDDQPVGPENIIPFDSSDEEDGDMGNSYIGELPDDSKPWE